MAVNFGANSSLSNLLDELRQTGNQGSNYTPVQKLPTYTPTPIKALSAPSGWLNGYSAQGAQSGLGALLGAASGQGGATGDLAKLMRAIRSQESSGNYGAVNSMSGAAGGYQIMPANLPQWSREALGHSVNMQQFMKSPQIQDAIAKYKLNQYLQKYGAAGAAAAWYGGPGAVKNMNSRTTQRGGYPSLAAYWNSVLAKM